MSVENLQDLLIDELKDILNAETQLIKAIPKLIKQCDSDALAAALEKHLDETKSQKTRVEAILTGLTGAAKGKQCKGMEGILEENTEMLEEIEDADVKDAAIIAGCQKVEHYEIASYGTVRTWAEQLGLSEVAEELQQILEEEENADRKLTAIAVDSANAEAITADDEKDESDKSDKSDKSDESDESEESDEGEGSDRRGSRTAATARGSSAERKPPMRSRKNKATA